MGGAVKEGRKVRRTRIVVMMNIGMSVGGNWRCANGNGGSVHESGGSVDGNGGADVRTMARAFREGGAGRMSFKEKDEKTHLIHGMILSSRSLVPSFAEAFTFTA